MRAIFKHLFTLKMTNRTAIIIHLTNLKRSQRTHEKLSVEKPQEDHGKLFAIFRNYMTNLLVFFI